MRVEIGSSFWELKSRELFGRVRAFPNETCSKLFGGYPGLTSGLSYAALVRGWSRVALYQASIWRDSRINRSRCRSEGNRNRGLGVRGQLRGSHRDARTVDAREKHLCDTHYVLTVDGYLLAGTGCGRPDRSQHSWRIEDGGGCAE